MKCIDLNCNYKGRDDINEMISECTVVIKIIEQKLMHWWSWKTDEKKIK